MTIKVMKLTPKIEFPERTLKFKGKKRFMKLKFKGCKKL